MLDHFRISAYIEVPKILKNLSDSALTPHSLSDIKDEVKNTFPKISSNQIFKVEKGKTKSDKVLKVCCILSGGPAPGGHNVIIGLYDALKELDHHHEIIGSIEGFEGFLNGHFKELNQTILQSYRNTGGFHLLGSSRKKISTPEDFKKAKAQVQKHHIDAIVVIGGDDSNTNAALLANYFLEESISCQVIGIPKTIDGDLQNPFVEVSFGFDTATKIYSEAIGNLLNDAMSAKKYYHFVKLMGRSASHITLECALNTHVNFAFIGEEMKFTSLDAKIHEICEMVVERAKLNKNYGCILIPEGLLEFTPEFNGLIDEINQSKAINAEEALKKLSDKNKSFFSSLPISVQNQIFLEKDPHGNIPLSQIQTELVIIDLVKKKLKTDFSDCKVDFHPTSHFLGYEGRCGFPTQFDCEYTYALGRLASLMLISGLTAYMAGFKNLKSPVEDWIAYSVPIGSLIHFKYENGNKKPVIEKTYVDLNSKNYLKWSHSKDRYKIFDDYKCIGPIQYFGPKDLVDQRPNILK